MEQIDFHLNKDFQTLVVGKECVKLDPRIFRLAEFFIAHPGKLLTRDEITENVWPPYSILKVTSHSTDVEPVRMTQHGRCRNVDVAVGTLRGCLKKVGSSVSIQSVRGIGYRLDVGQEETGGTVFVMTG